MKRVICITTVLIAGYLAAYAAAFDFRSPASNLAYWCYAPRSFPDWSENALYSVFFPAYLLHRSAFDGPRHNWDRETVPSEALAAP